MTTAAPNATVRPARPDDLDHLIDLIAAHTAYEQAPFDPTGKHTTLTKSLFDHQDAVCYVAEFEGQLVGYTTAAREFSTWDTGHFLHMDTLFVDERHRGHGIGNQLFGAVHQHALASGVSEIQWQTPTWNADAIRFYERLGATSATKERFSLMVAPRSAQARSNEATLAEFSAAWTARDRNRLAETLHVNCWYSPSIAHNPCQPSQGKQAILDTIEQMWRHDDGSTAELGPPRALSHDTIVRTWTYRFTTRPPEHGIDIFTFADSLLLGKDAYRKTATQDARTPPRPQVRRGKPAPDPANPLSS